MPAGVLAGGAATNACWNCGAAAETRCPGDTIAAGSIGANAEGGTDAAAGSVNPGGWMLFATRDCVASTVGAEGTGFCTGATPFFGAGAAT